MDYKVTHHPERRCFEAECDGYTAELEYRPYEGGIIFTHTYVPEPIEGRGVAACMVKKALKYARAHNLEIRATCSYVIGYLQRHPEEEAESEE